MIRSELEFIASKKKQYKVMETWLFGKPYAWILEKATGRWELEPIEE